MQKPFTYSEPMFETYLLPSHDFGAGAGTDIISGPDGHKGRLLNVTILTVTEVFNSVTTNALIRVGTSADPDKHAEMSIDDTADLGSDSILAAELYNTEIAADEDVHIDYVAPTGGTPTGIGQVQINIMWYK